MELLLQVENTIRSERLAGAGDRIVVAVSGGPDSMALLHVLFLLRDRLGVELFAAHVNHSFRGEESDREAETVVGYAKRLGIPCEVARIDVPAYIEESGMNPQAAAREKRYSFLHETAAKVGASKIALAHHADDQAETMLMRIIRGTGPWGLSGIPMRRLEKKVELIRPLLRIYKSELVRHCAECGIPAVQDSSNEERKYFRNEVRLDVLPYLRRYNDRLPDSLNRLAETMRAENEWMEREASKRFRELVTVGRGGGGAVCSLSAASFAELPVALQRRLIKLILNYVFSEADLSDYTRIESVRTAIVKERGHGVTLDLHDRLKLVREYDAVRFTRQAQPRAESYEYAVPAPDRTLDLPEAGMVLECRIVSAEEASRLPLSRTNAAALFDAEGVPFPLTVRSRRPGDRIEPFGLKGTKKVKDMFIDGKLPIAQRQRIPHVLDAAGNILWIPGVRRSSHAPVSEHTSRVLYMNVRTTFGGDDPGECGRSSFHSIQ